MAVMSTLGAECRRSGRTFGFADAFKLSLFCAYFEDETDAPVACRLTAKRAKLFIDKRHQFFLREGSGKNHVGAEFLRQY